MEDKQIIEMLKRIERNQKILLARTAPGRASTSFNEKDWVTTQVAMDTLGASLRTLIRRRIDGKIRWSKRGSEPCYFLPDILKLKNRYLK